MFRFTVKQTKIFERICICVSQANNLYLITKWFYHGQATEVCEVLRRWVELMLWPTVSRPIGPGIGHPFGAHDQISLFPLFCWKITLSVVLGRPPDERTGLQFIVQSVSGQSRGGLITIHYCLIWDYWVPFPSPFTTRRDWGGSILIRLHTGKGRWGPYIFIYYQLIDGPFYKSLRSVFVTESNPWP
jgi:hypothetical protein